ncbi:DUF3347 domain-containing protein [Antarcticibacterium flavum]|uniref:DUF3347 domain-containing protein n=1 Tax=Antarcticibacterium flavum TaxID=2058175 RepID=A0A5B7X7H2_9FLAO|nr:hypothetical protein [Antarcticibacterium sp. W02-3]QCY71436.1 DUF3347 domain-containing protein [Antarcticibacterium flavum]
MALVSWGANAQHNHGGQAVQQEIIQTKPLFKSKEVTKAYQAYLDVKDALIAAEAGKAQKAAQSLLKTLKKMDNSEQARAEAAIIASSTSLGAQRKSFAALSDEMTALVKNGQLSMGVVYVHFCPMANGLTGANWLSSQQEIVNPYMGENMKKCGSVKETIQ